MFDLWEKKFIKTSWGGGGAGAAGGWGVVRPRFKRVCTMYVTRDFSRYPPRASPRA